MRNCASAAAAALIGPAGPEAGCTSQPASPSSATDRPLARRTCAHGQYGGAPSPSQQNPRRTRGAGPARSISAASIAVLPMPASPLIIRNCPEPLTASPSTAPAAARASSRPRSRPAGLMGSIMAAQGRSSNTRFIGAGTSSLRTRPNPASAARARRRFSPACAPSGSEEVAVFWDTAFGVQASVETA